MAAVTICSDFGAQENSLSLLPLFPHLFPINSRQIDLETVETLLDFIFGGSKITADGDYSHKIKKHLLLGRKAMTNLDSILKIRDYFPNKCLSSQSYDFSSGCVQM